MGDVFSVVLEGPLNPTQRSEVPAAKLGAAGAPAASPRTDSDAAAPIDTRRCTNFPNKLPSSLTNGRARARFPTGALYVYGQELRNHMARGVTPAAGRRRVIRRRRSTPSSLPPFREPVRSKRSGAYLAAPGERRYCAASLDRGWGSRIGCARPCSRVARARIGVSPPQFGGPPADRGPARVRTSLPLPGECQPTARPPRSHRVSAN